MANGDVTSWRAKPKLHLMQELIEHQCLEARGPCGYRTYKDESWGAWLAKVAMRRGGKKVASSLALSVISKFRHMLHPQKLWKHVWGWMGLPRCSKVLLLWVLSKGPTKSWVLNKGP